MKHASATLSTWALCALACLCAGPAHAGRPLSTDDAATAEAGTCQVEAWHDQRSGERSLTLAPACGLPGGVEVGLEAVQLRPGAEVRAERGIALKWAPEAARLSTPAGEAALGLKLAAGQQRGPSAGWRDESRSALLLLSLQPSPTLAAHFNLGLARSRQAARQAALLNVALAWTPQERVLLFGEALANNRRELFGGTQATLGARWWLVRDRFGLDLTASRQAAARPGDGATRSLGLGLGWYGLGG